MGEEILAASLANERVAAARRFATSYTPRTSGEYSIHNEFFTPQRSYSADGLCALRQKLLSLGTFSIASDPKTGLIQTSDTINAAMRRQWFTDSVMVSHMQRFTDPAACLQATIVTAAALCTDEVRVAVEKTEADPRWYRDGGLMNGVYHIYLPDSVRCDESGLPLSQGIKADTEWFNQKRLESQALVLRHIVDALLEGSKNPATAWGFPSSQISSQAGQILVTAAISMARYLIAANSSPTSGEPDFHTPSASSWEEVPLPDGVTSDAGFTVLAFERLHQLLYASSSDSANLQSIRDAFFKELSRLKDPFDGSKILRWIAAGRDFIFDRIVRPIERGGAPIQNPARPLDTSLTLLAASDYTFCVHDPARDAAIRYEIIHSCSAALLGPNGMRRYNEFTLAGHTIHDSYLNILYHMPAVERARALGITGSIRDFGSSDASSLELLTERQALSNPDYAAQWTIGLSASIQALAKAKLSLLAADMRSSDLLHRVDSALTDMINRTIAAIPGKLSDQAPLRSDGSPLPLYQVMEAYEAIIDLNGRHIFVPGAHTLPWSTAQLFDGLRLAEEAARVP